MFPLLIFYTLKHKIIYIFYSLIFLILDFTKPSFPLPAYMCMSHPLTLLFFKIHFPPLFLVYIYFSPPSSIVILLWTSYCAPVLSTGRFKLQTDLRVLLGVDAFAPAYIQLKRDEMTGNLWLVWCGLWHAE